MPPNLLRKIKTLGLICLCACFAGAVYQLVNERRLDYNSVLMGLPLGLAFGIMELFLFGGRQDRFNRWSFTKILIFKSLLYTAVIFTVTLGLVVTIGLLNGRKMSELPAFLGSGQQLVLIFYSLVIYGLFVFFLQVNRLLGEGILWKFIRGQYHKPREEERIFMFLDMKSSTTIAERLGHVRFYALLNELFHEISYPVRQTKAQIYQYVGDEVILTWKMEHGLANLNCLRVFFMFKESIRRNTEQYLQNFGVNPEFKAGLHFGKVVSAQIGDIKREIVYNGDVLNTTSRIQNECNKYQRDFLISGDLMKRINQKNDFQLERIDGVTLRGKETEVEIFSVQDR